MGLYHFPSKPKEPSDSDPIFCPFITGWCMLCMVVLVPRVLVYVRKRWIGCLLDPGGLLCDDGVCCVCSSLKLSATYMKYLRSPKPFFIG
jgi:hypothetical protein